MKIKTNRVLHKPDFKPTQRFTCDLKNPPKELPPLRDGKGNIVLAPVLCKIVAGPFSGGFIEGKTVDGTRKWSSSYGSGFYFSRLADNSKYSIRHVDCADNDLFIDPDDYEQEPAPRAGRVQFDVTKFISNKETPVETRDGRAVTIGTVPVADGAGAVGKHPIHGSIQGYGSATFTCLGKWALDTSSESRYDLFFVNPPPAQAPEPEKKKERVQFDVTKFISNEKTPVVDRKGRPAKIVRTDAPAFHCGRPQPVEVQGHVEGYPSTRHYYADGRYHVGIDGTDLFFA